MFGTFRFNTAQMGEREGIGGSFGGGGGEVWLGLQASVLKL